MIPTEGEAPVRGTTWGDRFLGTEGHLLVLASASPRRAALLRQLGVSFVVRPAGISERIGSGEAPRDAARRLAADKARSVVRDGERALVVGADTLVVHDGEPLGKPKNQGDARVMLQRLSGAEHQVVTGLAVIPSRQGVAVADVAETTVRFRELSPTEITWMIESGEAMDKAGAYGIQGLASLVVTEIVGDYFNVVGLPLGLLRELIRKAVME